MTAMKTTQTKTRTLDTRWSRRNAQGSRRWPLEVALIGAIAAAMVAPGRAEAMLNPDAVYCEELGFTYHVAQTKKGVIGVCELPEGRLVNAAAFYHGEVALEHSYCAQQGLQARHHTEGTICGDCLVCITEDGQEVRAIKLMGLSFAESRCGDGHCGTMEDSSSCASDCPSGGLDELCDGLSDGICDPDCTNLGQPDPDCGGTAADPDDVGEGGCGCVTSGGTAGGAELGWLALVVGLWVRRRMLRVLPSSKTAGPRDRAS